jgi:hypothetical protein
MKRRMLFSLMALALAAWPAAAQGNPPTGVPGSPGAQAALPAYRHRLLGVYDGLTYQPMEGVEVSDVMNGTRSLTSSTGTVSLFFLPEDGGFVRIRKAGYEVVSMMVSISPADTMPVTVVLNRAGGATMMPTVVTTDSGPRYTSPTLKAFAERAKAAGGTFITDTVLRKRDDDKLNEVLSGNVAGAQFNVSGSGVYLTSARSSMASGGRCMPEVYLDGVRFQKVPDFKVKAIVGVDLNQFDVRTLGAVEFYPGGATLPPQFNGIGSGCGALLLWTRER